MVASVLLHHPFYSRAKLLFDPTLHFACRIFYGVAWVFLVLFYSENSVYAGPADIVRPPDVTIVQSGDNRSYAEFSDALRNILGGGGIIPIVINSSQTIPHSGLVISVGMEAATTVAASNAPAVLNVFISKAGYANLLHDFPRRADTHTFSAIFMDQPMYRQAHLVTAIFQDKHNVGLLYSSPPDGLANLRNELHNHGVKLQEEVVNSSLPLFEALQEVLQHSDVLLALPDTEVYNSSTIRNILLATYRSNVPLIGASSGYVNAGALCAVISTPTQIASQAAALIRQFGNTHSLPDAQYPKEFEVMVNKHVASSLGLQIKNAAVLHDIMSADDRSEP